MSAQQSCATLRCGASFLDGEMLEVKTEEDLEKLLEAKFNGILAHAHSTRRLPRDS